MIARGNSYELRLGDWRDVLAGECVDAVICDPPYGARTHVAKAERYDSSDVAGCAPGYTAWTPEHVLEFVTSWSPRCRGWMVAMTSHDLTPAWEVAHAAVGRYCFAPVPIVMRGMSVRLAGDGPSSWTVYAMVARPRTKEFAAWGTLDGAYSGPPSREAGGGRGKPGWLLQALVRDYTKPSDRVADPFAGHGSTLEAAAALGRTAIGAEVDGAAYAEAVSRLGRPQQYDLLAGGA